MDRNITERLKEYILDEFNDSALYKELADNAPNEEYKKILMGMSQDEHNHAINFGRIYRKLTGKSFAPKVDMPKIQDSFKEVLRKRILSEANDFKKYGEEYLNSNNWNRELKDAFYRARTDENVHAHYLTYMYI